MWEIWRVSINLCRRKSGETLNLRIFFSSTNWTFSRQMNIHRQFISTQKSNFSRSKLGSLCFTYVSNARFFPLWFWWTKSSRICCRFLVWNGNLLSHCYRTGNAKTVLVCGVLRIKLVRARLWHTSFIFILWCSRIFIFIVWYTFRNRFIKFHIFYTKYKWEAFSEKQQQDF